MKIGDTFETATCANCQRPIRHTFWGDGGNRWEHLDGSWDCARSPHATPRHGTVEPATKPRSTEVNDV
jgi:hypothetical protein